MQFRYSSVLCPETSATPALIQLNDLVNLPHLACLLLCAVKSGSHLSLRHLHQSALQSVALYSLYMLIDSRLTVTMLALHTVKQIIATPVCILRLQLACCIIVSFQASCQASLVCWSQAGAASVWDAV